MSPQVSQPRRRLPTGAMSAAGRVLAQRRDDALAASSCASGSRCRPAWRLRSSRALRISASFLAPMPAKRADAAVGCGPLEIVERADAELAIERRDRLRPDALQVQQVEDGRRKLGDELAVVLRVAGLGDLADARREVLADAGNLAQPGGVERRERVRMIGDDVGAVAIRADLERVVVLDLEQIGDLPEDARDAEVIQAAGLRSRCGSRAPARRRAPAPRRSPVARAGGP